MSRKYDIIFDSEARIYIARNVKEVLVVLKNSGTIEGRVRVSKKRNAGIDIFIGKERLNGDMIDSYLIKKSLRRSRNVQTSYKTR